MSQIMDCQEVQTAEMNE